MAIQMTVEQALEQSAAWHLPSPDMRALEILAAEVRRMRNATDGGEYEFVIIELSRDNNGNGVVAASGLAPTQSDAEREAAHYAAQYAHDGEIEVAVYRIHRERVSSVLMGPNDLAKPPGAALCDRSA